MVVQQYKEKLKVNETMNIVFVGHVDHGKSTVIGRLLADTNSLPEGKIEQLQAVCDQNNEPFEYAYLIDALKDERAQSITIDSARVFFKSETRHYIILDAPGHIEFIKNMVTGASHAEAAVLVIDAHEGVQENSRRHGYLLWMLGIKQIVVLVNKMDLVDYDERIFEKVQKEYSRFLKKIKVAPLCYIPVSGREGDNIPHSSKNMPWYQGETVLSALDRFEKARPLIEKPFRMPVQDIYKFNTLSDERRIVAGTISSGKIKVGDQVIFYPSAKSSVVKSIERFSAAETDSAFCGEAVGFTLEEQIYIQRGQVAALVNEQPPQVSTKIRVSLFWLGKNPMVLKKQYVLKLGTTRVNARIVKIHTVMDASNYSKRRRKNAINHHDVAECTLELSHPIGFDLSSDLIPDTSRFVIVDDYEIWGGGIIINLVEDTQSELYELTSTRERKWIRSNVNSYQRAEKYNQRSALIIISGEKGIGRKTLATILERQLFEDGKFVYYLGIGSVLYGVNADLKRDNPGNNWPEHLRRISEVAHLLLDAGLILILTAVELTQKDINIIQTIVEPDKIETIWVGDQVTTDITYDLQIPSDLEPESSVLQIKWLMQEHGIIFSP